MSGFYSYDAWKTTPPPDESDDLSLCSKCGEWSEWEESQCPRCGYGEPLYTCDSCDRQVPQDEIRHIRESYCGETYQCEQCLDAAFAEASGGYRRRGGEG